MCRYDQSVALIAALVAGLLFSACAAPATPPPTAIPTQTSQPASPTAVPTQTPQPPLPTTAPTETPEPPTPTAEPTSTVVPAARLPAPLYFLAGGQIHRLEMDGTTVTTITAEPDPVIDFDVSLANGMLVYVSGNNLIRADAFGGDPMVLVEGPTQPDEHNRIIQIGSPRFAPGGAQIAFAMDGVRVISATGGEPRVIKPNDPPGPGAGTYSPVAWSPDGRRLLINFSFYTHGGQLLVRNLEDGSEVSLGASCCQPAWGWDAKSVYVSGPFYGPEGRPGLRHYDVETGVETTLIEDDLTDDILPLVAYARQLGDGQLYMFARTATQEEYTQAAGAVDFTMYRAPIDDVSARTALRTDSYVIHEALWAKDASGAVIAAISGGTDEKPPLIWVPTDGGPAVPLPARGDHLRWGPADVYLVAEIGGRALIGGPSETVAVAEDKVYLTVGAQLVVLDAGDPAQPRVLGVSPSLVGDIANIRVADEMVYATSGAGGLQIIDVSNPAAPNLRGHFQATWIADVSLMGGEPYAVAVGSGLHVLDVSDPDAPGEIGSLELDAPANRVTVVGNLAYAPFAQGSRNIWFFGIHIVDVSAPASPRLLTSSYETGPPLGIQVAGDLAYVAAGDRGLEIVDVSDPAAPKLLNSFETKAGDVAVIDNLAYVADWNHGLQIIDVSDPAAPKLLGTVDTPGQARGISVASDRAYIAAGEHGLQIIDVSDPTAPRLLGGYDAGWRRKAR